MRESKFRRDELIAQSGLPSARDRCQPAPPRDKNDLLPPVSPTFGIAETRAWLENMRSDVWWQTQMPIAENALAKCLGVNQARLGHNLHFRHGCNDKIICGKIGRLIPDIECRRLAFPDTQRTGKRMRGMFTPKFLWLDAPVPPPRIPKLDKESAWSLWACCQTCGKNKFLPIIMNAEPHVACYYCIPPSQYRPIGATRVNRTLIGPALKKYY